MQETEARISKRQEELVRKTNYLIATVDRLAYADFKDSIRKIPAAFLHQSSYYTTVINKISRIKPDYVVLLYKDFPENRTLIEFAVENDKIVRRRFKQDSAIK